MEVNHRFSIAQYTGNEFKINSNSNQINSIKFSQLCSKSQIALQDRLNSRNLQDVFKNKSVSMIFLDKISNLIGEHHPDSLEAKMFMGGPSLFPSMELIRHLTDLKSSPTLSKSIIQNLEKWILSEQNSLPISMIFDAWGAINEESVIRNTTKGDFPDMPATQIIVPPLDEVEVFSKALAQEMQSMQPGSKFKMPAGSLQHVTRLEFTKNSDGTYDIIHFNTGLGVIEINHKESTACKYRSIPAEKLEDPKFWKHLVDVKMQPDMTLLNDLLKNLNTEIPPIDLHKWLKKPLQLSGSCSFHAAEAEFKHSFITSFSSLEEGWEAYKQCTSLMAKNAVICESSSLESSIAKMLAAKEKLRRRYLDWMTILDNPEKLKNAQTAYIKAISDIGCSSEAENYELIKSLTPLMAFSILDKRLNNGLDHITYERLMEIRNTYEEAVSFNGFNHIGYRQLKWLESTQKVFHDVIKFAGWKGDLLFKIRDLSTNLLPNKWSTEIQTMINRTSLDKDSLISLLTEYILREETTKGNVLLQNLMKEKIISENFSYDGIVIYTHIINCLKSDPKRALQLAMKPMESPIREEVLSRISIKLITQDDFETAYKFAHLLKGCKNHAALSKIAFSFAAKNEIVKALSTAKLINNNLSGTLTAIIDKLCKKGLIPPSLKLAHLIEKEEIKYQTLYKIAFELVEKGKEKAAMRALQTIPFSNLGPYIQQIVAHLCEQNKINEAVIFAYYIPKEFYQDPLCMDLEESLQYIVISLIENSRRQDALAIAKWIPDGALKDSISLLANKFQTG